MFLVSSFLILHSAFSFDFGSAPSTAIIHHDFIVTNAADTPLGIGKVRPSCDCLQVLSWPRVIPPNAAGAISVRLLPDKLGPVAYRVFVEYVESSTLNVGSWKFPATSAPLVFTMSGLVTPTQGARNDSPLAAIAPELFTRAVTARDESCYICASDIIAQDRGQRSEVSGQDSVSNLQPSAFSLQPFIIVDLRSPEAFAAVHIPGALNIPVHLLRTKAFLRSANVVLADNYGGDPALEQACRGLRSDGFAAVAILRGGLNAWRRAGGALEGEASAVKNISSMSPADYSKVRDFSDWRVVYAGSDLARASAFIPEIQNASSVGRHSVAPFQNVGAALARARSGSEKSKIENKNVLLVTDDGKNYESASAEVSGLKDATVFYLSGGIAGYKNYLRLASARPQKHSIQTKSAQSGSSPKQSGTGLGLVRRKPCGGCS